MSIDSLTSDRDPFEQVAESFLSRYRNGERPSVDEYAQEHPELADQIRELFPALLEMEQIRPAVAELDQAGSVCQAPPAPRQLGEYRILREVGRGGMGVVYEAVQESLGRHVALKVLPYNALANPVHLERFRREAKAAARLHHTNIVPVFGVGEHEGIHYYAMQFILGQGVDEVLAEVRRLRGEPQVPAVGNRSSRLLAASVAEGLLSGNFPEQVSASDGTEPVSSGSPAQPEHAMGAVNAANASCRDRPSGQAPAGTMERLVRSASVLGAQMRRPDDAILTGSGIHSEITSQPGAGYYRSVAELGLQVADALAYAHGQGVLHRDVKPSNLLLDTAGRVWVTDFGLAKADDSDDLTETGDLVGTLCYMAPERVQGRADARSDVYGLGITLYEMLTLKRAFRETNRARLMERVVHEQPAPARRLDRHIPRDLETIVLKALAKDPAARYPTAEALAEDLRRFLADRPVRARRTSALEQTWRWSRRNPAWAAVAVLLLVVAVIASLAAWKTEQSRREADAARQKISEAMDRQNAAYMLVQGARFLTDFGTFAQAEADLTRAVTTCPESSMVWVERGYLYVRLGLWDLAAADFARAFRVQEPATPREWHVWATLLAYTQDADGYRRLCTRLPTRFPEGEVGEYRNQLVRAMTIAPSRDIDLSWTVAVAEKAVQEDGHRAWDLYALGKAHFRIDEFRRAVAYFKESLDRDSSWQNGTLNFAGLAMAHHQLGDIEQSRNALAEAKEAMENLSRDLFIGDRLIPANYGNWWEHWLECQLVYREAALLVDRKTPAEDGRLWLVRGRALARLKHEAEAAACFERARRLRPADVEIRLALAPPPDDPQQYSGELTRLEKRLQRLPAPSADGRFALAQKFFDLGQLFETSNQPEAAAKAYSGAIDLVSDFQDAWYRRELALAQLKAASHRLAGAGPAPQPHPGPAKTSDLIERGNRFAERGEWKQAAEQYAKAFQFGPPEDPVLWFEYAYLRLQVGDRTGYQQLCRQMDARFGDPRDHRGISLLAHTCVLAADALPDPQRVLELAQQRMANGDVDSWNRAWSVHVLALAYYRTGSPQKAIEHLRKRAEPRVHAWREEIQNGLVFALAHARLRQSREARDWLNRADCAIVEQKRARPAAERVFAPPGWHWRNWLGVHLLREEASGLLGDHGSVKPSVTGSSVATH
jgi:serine/threonine protein kinase/Flp pilus assembly protein TadD